MSPTRQTSPGGGIYVVKVGQLFTENSKNASFVGQYKQKRTTLNDV